MCPISNLPLRAAFCVYIYIYIYIYMYIYIYIYIYICICSCITYTITLGEFIHVTGESYMFIAFITLHTLDYVMS